MSVAPAVVKHAQSEGDREQNGLEPSCRVPLPWSIHDIQGGGGLPHSFFG